VEEFDKMQRLEGPATPRIYGFCATKESAWLLVESAVTDLDHLDALQQWPGHTDVLRMFLTITEFFVSLDAQSYSMVDFAPKQFLVTKDWRVLLGDFDGVKSKAHLGLRLSSIWCKTDNDCRVLVAWVFKAHLQSNDYTCHAGACSGYLTDKHIVELLAVHVFSPIVQHFKLSTALVHECVAEVATRPSLRELHSNLKKQHFASQRLGAFGNYTFGYQADTSYWRRGLMILGELYATQPASAPFTIADWGSNFGWFSSFVAASFPSSNVFSMEGGLQPDASEGLGIKHHKAFLADRGIENNVVCGAYFNATTFQVFRAAKLRFDYQLLLSVIHWIDKWPQYEATRTSWEEHACLWLQTARTSFVEMVNPRGAVNDGADKDHPVWVWYDKRNDEQEVLEQTLASCGVQAVVKEVKFQATGFQHAANRALLVLKQEEQRRMFRVDLQEQASAVGASQELLTCAGVLGPIGCRQCAAQHP
jgi:hypothetical protein